MRVPSYFGRALASHVERGALPSAVPQERRAASSHRQCGDDTVVMMPAASAESSPCQGGKGIGRRAEGVGGIWVG